MCVCVVELVELGNLFNLFSSTGNNLGYLLGAGQLFYIHTLQINVEKSQSIIVKLSYDKKNSNIAD